MYIIDADAHPPIELTDIDCLGKITHEEFLERIARTGADAVMGVPSMPEGMLDSRASTLITLALDTAALSRKLNGRWIPGIWIHPGDALTSFGLIAEYSCKGIRLCGDIRRAWLDEYPAEMDYILGCAARNGMAASFVGCAPDQLRAVAKQHPTLKMIVRGVGILPAIDLMAECPNMYLVTTGHNIGNYILHNLLEKLPADRVLYGSGYPYCNPGYQKGSIDWELRDTSEETRAAVMGGNALRLICSGGKKTGGKKA